MAKRRPFKQVSIAGQKKITKLFHGVLTTA